MTFFPPPTKKRERGGRSFLRGQTNQSVQLPSLSLLSSTLSKLVEKSLFQGDIITGGGLIREKKEDFFIRRLWQVEGIGEKVAVVVESFTA